MQIKSSGHSKLIYFDNAATSLPKPSSVGQAILESLNEFGGAGRGGHPASLKASRCIYNARRAVADMLGSKPERIVFTSNSTESLNISIQGLITPKDHIITTALEHNSVLRPLYRLKVEGMGMSIVGLNDYGSLHYSEFQKFLRPNTKAVICTHASNLTGELIDLNIISSFCKENKLLLIVDASQTAGVFPINADKQGIDVLCFTGHKGLFGPQGTGGICIRYGLNIVPMKVGGSGMHSYSPKHPNTLPEALEAGTLNAHGIAGLLAGIDYITETGMDVICKRVLHLTRIFRDGISKISGVQIYGDPNRSNAPIVTLNIDTMDSGMVGDRLSQEYEICVRSGTHCAPLAHVALNIKEQGAVRFSFSHFNTEDEIQTGIRAISEIAQWRISVGT